jgi:tetratricopeptide (TPR) repeat protein
MRHLFASLLGSICLLAIWACATPSQVAGQTAQPPSLSPPPNSRDVEEMQRQLAKLRAQREALAQDAILSSSLVPANAGQENQEIVKLRQHLADLMKRVQSKPETPKAPAAEPRPPQMPELNPRPGTEKVPAADPVETAQETLAPPDPAGLAHALFRTGNSEQALKAYRLIKLNGMEPQERLPLQYLMAACLRKLGKTEEASAMFREIANTRGDEQVAACAQWQLSIIRWKNEYKTQLQQIRERTKALEP